MCYSTLILSLVYKINHCYSFRLDIKPLLLYKSNGIYQSGLLFFLQSCVLFKWFFVLHFYITLSTNIIYNALIIRRLCFDPHNRPVTPSAPLNMDFNSPLLTDLSAANSWCSGTAITPDVWWSRVRIRTFLLANRLSAQIWQINVFEGGRAGRWMVETVQLLRGELEWCVVLKATGGWTRSV